MSITPTAGNATFINSGRCVIVAPTGKPPFDPPTNGKKSEEVFLSNQIFCRSDEIINTFCFCNLVPASCHFFHILRPLAG
jgi:hypothetical protein